MSGPVILGYAKGHITEFWGDSQSLSNIIPVDMVVNAAIAAMAKHGCGISELKVYNVTSSSHAHPLRAGELFDLCHQHLHDSPLIETVIDLERFIFHTSVEDFTSSFSNRITKQEREMNNGREKSHTTMSMKGKRKLQYFMSLARTYQPYLFFQTWFDDTNTRSLIQEMSMEERKMFEFDCKCIDWEDYIVNVHVPALKRELFQERSS